jgi:hypothetical protein
VEAEIQILRTLCDEAVPRERRSEIFAYYARHNFIEPEHQIVFESIRALFPYGAITPARMIAHLTNRGFPDIDAAKYLRLPSSGSAPSGSSELD